MQTLEKPSRDTLIRGWMLGFTEGEGSFNIGISKQPDRRYGLRVQARFEISLHEKDLSALKRIQKELRMGHIYFASNETKRKQGSRSSDVECYTVNSLRDCLRIRRYFETFDEKDWLTTKYRDFKKWSQVLDLIVRKAHFTANGIVEIALIRDQMNNPGKKQKDYRPAQDIALDLKNNYRWTPSSQLKEKLDSANNEEVSIPLPPNNHPTIDQFLNELNEEE